MEFLRFDDLKGQVVGIHVGKLGNIWKHFNDPDGGHYVSATVNWRFFLPFVGSFFISVFPFKTTPQNLRKCFSCETLKTC